MRVSRCAAALGVASVVLLGGATAAGAAAPDLVRGHGTHVTGDHGRGYDRGHGGHGRHRDFNRFDRGFFGSYFFGSYFFGPYLFDPFFFGGRFR
ncbi:hypothetical protein [Actinacidiphila sp. bgisy167]|uniref:hypothetical protein n=1 Tax=Actinacidiphila sp. bgisy167 TaxID=3413797 RepID=UPI003D73CC03